LKNRRRYGPFPPANHLQSLEQFVRHTGPDLSDNLPHVALIVPIWRFAQPKKCTWRERLTLRFGEAPQRPGKYLLPRRPLRLMAAERHRRAGPERRGFRQK